MATMLPFFSATKAQPDRATGAKAAGPASGAVHFAAPSVPSRASMTASPVISTRGPSMTGANSVRCSLEKSGVPVSRSKKPTLPLLNGMIRRAPLVAAGADGEMPMGTVQAGWSGK